MGAAGNRMVNLSSRPLQELFCIAKDIVQIEQALDSAPAVRQLLGSPCREAAEDWADRSSPQAMTDAN